MRLQARRRPAPRPAIGPRARNRSRVPAGDRYDGLLGSGRLATSLPLAWPGEPAAPIPPVWRSRAPTIHHPLSSDARGAQPLTCCPAACPGEDDVSSGADGRDVLRARPWRPRHRPLGTLRWDLAGSTGTRSLRERRGLRLDRSWLACPVPGGFAAQRCRRWPGSGPAVAAWMAKRMMDSSMMWRGARSALPSPGRLDRRPWAASGRVTAEGGPAVPQTCAGFSAPRLRVACVLAASGFTTWPPLGFHMPARLCARPGACMPDRQPWTRAARLERDAGGLACPAQGRIPALVDRPRAARQGRRVHRLPQAAGWPLAVPLCPHAGRAGVWAPDRGAGGPNWLRSGR
jgi:hypothetical protein